MGVRLYVNDKPVDTIFYTIDGSTPTENSSIYLIPIELEESTTIKAFAVFEDGTIGPVSAATYTLSPRLPLPRFIPPTGANTPTIVTIEIPDHGDADIWYTVNGSTPSNTNGTLYIAPVSITGTVMLKALGYRAGYRPSRVATLGVRPDTFSCGREHEDRHPGFEEIDGQVRVKENRRYDPSAEYHIPQYRMPVWGED